MRLWPKGICPGKKIPSQRPPPHFLASFDGSANSTFRSCPRSRRLGASSGIPCRPTWTKHLNELIFDAASRCERSEFLVFCYSDIPETLAKRAVITPNLQIAGGREAILGGVRGEWEVPKDGPPGLWVEDQFGLRDFKHLAAHLARCVTREPEGETLLRELVEKVATKRKVEGGVSEHA